MNKDQPQPIVFICSRLDTPGGIERGVVNVANLLESKGHNVSILILDKISTSFYPIHPGIQVLHANLHFGITEKGNFISRKIDFVKQIRQLSKILRQIKAGVIIGTEFSFTIASFFARPKSARLFAWEHHHFYWLKKNTFWNFLFQKVYPKLDKVICLNETEKQLYEKIGCKTSIIPYYIIPQKKSSLSSKNLLTIGWLIKRKGVDLIPQIADEVFKIYPDWKWTIIGTGEEEEHFNREIRERKLTSNITVIAPQTHDLSSFYLSSSIYVMTSRFEGLPMVLLESIAHGIPCIAFDCPSGVNVIIQDGANGFLIKQDDVQSMAMAIIRLISNEEERKQMGLKAHESVERFSPETVYSLWKQLIG